jgi:hypothetical protein
MSAIGNMVHWMELKLVPCAVSSRHIYCHRSWRHQPANKLSTSVRIWGSPRNWHVPVFRITKCSFEFCVLKLIHHRYTSKCLSVPENRLPLQMCVCVFIGTSDPTDVWPTWKICPKPHSTTSVRFIQTFIFIHHSSVVCLTRGLQSLPKRVLHRVRISASSFNFQHPF